MRSALHVHGDICTSRDKAGRWQNFLIIDNDIKEAACESPLSRVNYGFICSAETQGDALGHKYFLDLKEGLGGWGGCYQNGVGAKDRLQTGGFYSLFLIRRWTFQLCNRGFPSVWQTGFCFAVWRRGYWQARKGCCLFIHHLFINLVEGMEWHWIRMFSL